MNNCRLIYPAFGMLIGLMFIYFALAKKMRENFFGMSPGTLTQLQSSRVPQYHRFKPYDNYGALEQTPLPYLIY